MLQAVELSKKYGNHIALNKLNLSVQKGDIFCLLGQNGAGKTTTINLFLGFIKATSGEALINNKKVVQNGNITKKHIAYIPEVVTLYGNLTSIENLNFFSKLAGYKYTKTELQNLLHQVGLQEDAHHKKLNTFSKGMRQKVGIAIALSKNADVLLMDEPTSGLDPKATNEFTLLVKELGRQGKSILIATHDLFNAVNVATHIGIMKAGELVHTIKASEIDANDLQKLYLETI